MQISVKHCLFVVMGMAILAVPVRAEFLYVANGPGISAYRITESGALTPVIGSPFGVNGPFFSMALDVPGRILFTRGDGTISAYRISWNGVLTLLAVSKAGINPDVMAVDPFGRFLYVTNLDREPSLDPSIVDHVSAYRIGENGALTPVPGLPLPAGIDPDCAVADPTGRFVYVGNNGGAQSALETISAYRVGGNGTLIRLPGSPFRDGEEPQSMGVDPFGRFLYTAGQFDLALLTYRIAGTGILTNLPGSSFRLGAGYQDLNTLAVDPFARFVYQSSAPYMSANGTLSVYRVGANGLTFSSSYLTPGLFAYSMVADLSGQFLYAKAVDLGGTVGANGIFAYRIAGNGVLTAVKGSPFAIASGGIMLIGP